MLLRNGWRAGFVLLAVVLLTARGASQPGTHSVHLGQHPLAAAGSLGPTIVGCNTIQTDTTWDAAHSPYILPYNFNNDPAGSTDPNACPDFPRPGQTSTEPFPPGVVIPPGVTLTIDASGGSVQIFSFGAGLYDQGGQIVSRGTGLNVDGTYHTIRFDPDQSVASWDGIWITTGPAGQLGAGNLDYTGIQKALTAINIDSGSTAFSGYGLVFTNGAIGYSYFDGIDSTNTPVQLLGQGDGRFGTVNNIGSQGLKLTFTKTLATALDVEKEVFGSSLPFAQTNCLPLQPCAAGTIGNDAILGNFSGQQNVKIAANSFFRAGSFGIDLENAVHPQITNNDFVCNGSGSPTPVTSCAPNGTLLTSSAIYLNNVTADLPDDTSNQFPPLPTDPQPTGVSNNFGQQNGLDAVVLSGSVTSNVNWKTPTNDPSPPDATHLPQRLGFMVGNIAGTGSLQLQATSLTVKAADVVKVTGGGITLNGGTLNATGNGLKTFTSMRDNTIGIQACPSIFVQSCPPVLPAATAGGLSGEEWAGINLLGATANINDASILFATKAVSIAGTPVPGSYNLQLTNSFIGPTFSDSVVVKGVPALIQSNKFCRIDPTTENCFASANPAAVAGPGARGINADYSANAFQTGDNGLTIIGNDFEGSANEAIIGTALTHWPVVVETNTITRAGAYGIQLVAPDNLTLEANTVRQTGFGATLTYPAIYLNDVLGGNFDNSAEPTPPLTTAQLSCSPSPNCIRWNSGSGNAINAIAFHGTSSSLTWISPTNVAGPLGYLLDNSLAVSGDLTLNTADVAEVGQGSITISGKLSSAGAILTSFKEPAANLPANYPPICASVFDPQSLGPSGPFCPAPAAGDWGGLVLTNSVTQSTISDSAIRYASTGISANGPLSVLRGAISFTTAEGILDTGLTSTQQVRVEDLTVDHAGTYGIHLVPSATDNLNGGNLRLVGNQVTNSGTGSPRYPAIALGLTLFGNFLPPQGAASSFCATTAIDPCVEGNTGGGNGVNALVFHGTMGGELDWVTPQNVAAAQAQALGYLLDGNLNMGGNQLTVKAGDVVKIAPAGLIDLAGGVLSADNTDNAIQKVFTTLADNNTAAAAACPSVLISDCSLTPSNYWAGIRMEAVTTGLGTATANGSLVNANLRYAGTAIDITSGASSTIGSTTFGLVISHSTIGPASSDAIDTVGTSISVSNSTISNVVHGIDADLTNAKSTPALFLSGNRFATTSAEAILGQALAGRPVWISDNHIIGSGTFGIRLLGANGLVLRNNNVSTSGTGAVIYPAIYLAGVTADFTNDVRGNVGQGNGINAILFDGTADGDMAWRTPKPTSDTTTQPLGYMLDGSLTLEGGNLSVGRNDVVKGLGGAITLNGGTLTASGSGGTITFSSVKDPNGSFASCPSFLADCGPAPGDWGGLVLTGGSGGTIDHSLINYAATGVSTDSGPISAATPNLKVTYTTIVNTKQDGINSVDTPIDVEHTFVGDPSMVSGVVLAPSPNIGRYGIIASFLSPPNCPASCERLVLLSNTVASTAKDGIAATGLGGQPVDIENNIVTGAGSYGIRLVGADQLSLKSNTISSSGGPTTTFHYPAIYLSAVKADFETTVGATPMVAGNHGSGNGINAMVLHGEAVNGLTWLTTGVPFTPPPPPPSPPAIPADHFGYMLDGNLIVDGTFTTNPLDVVKVLGGSIKINGGLAASGTTFTSMKDGNVTPKACDSGFDSVFIQRSGGVCPPASSSDWNGINIDATSSSFNGGKLLYASSGIAIANASLTVSGATFAGIGGAALSSTGSSSQPLTVDCSSVRRNGTGITADYATVTNSDVYGNGTDLHGNTSLTATTDWLGATPTTSGTVTVTGALSAQQPSATLTLTSNNPLGKKDKYGNPAYGSGTLSLTAAFDRKMSTLTPLAEFGLVTPNTTTFIGTLHQFTGLSSSWSSDGLTWTPNAYPLVVGQADAGENLLQVSGGRDCVPPELDGTPTNPDSNLMTQANQPFSAAILPTVLNPTAASGFYGGTASLSANLTANGANAVSQTVTFKVPGQTAINATTNGSGDASVPAAPLGTLTANTPHTYQVSYAGDPDQFFTPAPAASGLPITATLTVNPAPTTTSGPTSSLASSTYGQAVDFSATVTTNVSGGINPGSSDGMVSFQSGATTICSAALGTGGSTNVAKCTTSTLAASATPYVVSAMYTPIVNGNFVGSTSATTVNQTVSQAATTTMTPASDVNPSTYGQTIKLSAQVTSTYLNPGAADGSVTFKEGPTTICSAALGTGSSTNEAACTTNQLAQGAHTITANFTSANTNYGDSTAATTLSQTVNAASTTTSTPTSDLNPSTTAQAVDLTATVTAIYVNPGSSDGSVAFMEGATTLCTASLGTGGSSNAASCSYTFPTTGTHTVTAVFMPANTNFSGSTSTGSLTQTVT